MPSAAEGLFYLKPDGRNFAVYQRWEPLLIEEAMDPKPDQLVCICAYKKGAEEVIRRLEGRVQVQRKMVVCRACRKNLGIKGSDVPTDVELAAEPEEEYG